MKNDDSELPELIRHSNGDVQMSFSSENMKLWIRDGLIPPELASAFQERQERLTQRYDRIAQFRKTNPNASCDELMAFLGIPRVLSKEETAQTRRDAQNEFELQRYMIQKWDILVSAVSEKGKRGLFRAALQPNQFGVSRIESDPLYHFRDLLDAMEIRHLEDNNYRARGEIPNSKGQAVVLEYDFRATNHDLADKVLQNYKAMMSGKGLRAFLAYWCAANEKGGRTFRCSISNVMDSISSAGSTSYHSDKDRADFWAITLTLAATKFRLEWIKDPKRPRKKPPKVSWIEQPLLQIHGGEREIDEECPISVKVTVLTKESAAAHFAPAPYARETLQLHPADILFATTIQARAAQRPKQIAIDWDVAFKVANVGASAKTNRRVAKRLVRKKLDRFQQKTIIHRWTDDKDGVQIQPKKIPKGGLNERKG